MNEQKQYVCRGVVAKMLLRGFNPLMQKFNQIKL